MQYYCQLFMGQHTRTYLKIGHCEESVTLANAGVHSKSMKNMDSRLRGNDGRGQTDDEKKF